MAKRKLCITNKYKSKIFKPTTTQHTQLATNVDVICSFPLLEQFRENKEEK